MQCTARVKSGAKERGGSVQVATVSRMKKLLPGRRWDVSVAMQLCPVPDVRPHLEIELPPSNPHGAILPNITLDASISHSHYEHYLSVSSLRFSFSLPFKCQSLSVIVLTVEVRRSCFGKRCSGSGRR